MHQESARIGATLRLLAAHRAELGDCELILVDDGSNDATAAVAEAELRATGLPGHVVQLPRNGGKGAAISAGVAVARGEAVAFTDADLAAEPEAIARCFELIETGEADVVVTSRHLPDSEVTVPPPLARRSTSAMFRRVARWAGLRSVTDSQCGLKAFRGDVAKLLFRELSVQRFAFDVEVLLRAELAGLQVVETPIRWRHVDASSIRAVRDGARMLFDVVRLRTRLRGWEATDKTPIAAMLEREHWWYVANREAALDAAARAGAGGLVIDLDCQTGALLDDAAVRDGAIGLTASSGSARLAAARHPTVVTSPLHLAVAPGRAGTAYAVDLLEHLDDDGAFVREAARALAPGGMFVATVPSNPRLWTAYDVSLGHRRRYSPDTLRALLSKEGFDVMQLDHFFAWLSPITFVLARTPMRSLLLRDPERASFVHRRINRVLRVVVAAERKLRARVPLPFGQALVVVARRR